jgi:hypothetical protein
VRAHRRWTWRRVGTRRWGGLQPGAYASACVCVGGGGGRLGRRPATEIGAAPSPVRQFLVKPRRQAGSHAPSDSRAASAPNDSPSDQGLGVAALTVMHVTPLHMGVVLLHPGSGPLPSPGRHCERAGRDGPTHDVEPFQPAPFPISKISRFQDQLFRRQWLSPRRTRCTPGRIGPRRRRGALCRNPGLGQDHSSCSGTALGAEADG